MLLLYISISYLLMCTILFSIDIDLMLCLVNPLFLSHKAQHMRILFSDSVSVLLHCYALSPIVIHNQAMPASKSTSVSTLVHIYTCFLSLFLYFVFVFKLSHTPSPSLSFSSLCLCSFTKLLCIHAALLVRLMLFRRGG